ncbi:uncharacterized protein LOC108905016 [Anoplophora glabripennis]|uniref:uncharacterized protein LOC108905016 n=1 Tax=Anoplophora glabripennis TaxID=217634 RepID=UPI000874B67F|nr:uncharacterized protein LOC108905016 [Anoplophora glabripennis]
MDSCFYTYNNTLWRPSLTISDKNSFFHAAFGMRTSKDDAYHDKYAKVRRMRWATFLTYFANETIPPSLLDILLKCLSVNDKYRQVLLDDKVLFEDYITDVMKAEMDVMLEDIPILATLENIRIIVLSDRRPDSILVAEPNAGILGNYSVGEKYKGEVVLSLTGNTFLRLNPVEEDPVRRYAKNKSNDGAEDNTIESHLKQRSSFRYKKSGNAGSEGVQFQVSLLTVCLLNALRTLKNWKLSTENEAAGKFDDMVLEWSEGALLLQAKHRQNKTKKITFQELMSTNSKCDDFSLAKYFISYQEIKRKFKIRNVIICSNAKFEEKAQEFLNSHVVSSESLLYHAEDNNTFYTFNDKILTHLKQSVNSYYEKNCESKSIHDEIIREENLYNFLNDLQFYPNYPSGQHMRKAIGQLLLLVKYSRDLRHQIYDNVMDWFQQRNGIYFTEVHAKAKFLEFRRDKYWQELKQYDVLFKNNDINFQDQTRIYNIIVEEGQLLHKIKIHHALSNNQMRTLYFNDENNLKAQRQILEAFELSDYTFLVIISFKTESLVEEIRNRLETILNEFEFKKVILLTDSKQKTFVSDKLTCSVNDKIVTFGDLLEATQMKLLLKKNIIFQGERVTLQDLIGTKLTKNYEHILKPEILEKLIKDKDIIVGAPLLNLEENFTKFYINRKFKRNVLKSENSKKRANPSDQILYEETIYEVNEKVILISDCAGMGKSTVLTNITQFIKRKRPRLWVIRVDLNYYTKILMDSLENNRETITMLELLNSKHSTRLTNQLEKDIFLMKGKVVLILDGVDEISPDYTGLVLGLLVECKEAPNYAKVFVTTRPHMIRELEAKLQVKSFSLQPFTEHNQIDFLVTYWMQNLKADYWKRGRCEQYAKALISKMSSWIKLYHCGENHFAAIPLQVRMLAEIFQERWTKSTDWEVCKDYLNGHRLEPELPEITNIKNLYDMFIQKTRDLFIYKGNPNGNPTANDALIRQFNVCLTCHRHLALKVILDKRKFDLFSNYKQFDEDVEKNLLKIGIVHRFDDKFRFVHRTFAEYFVAESILEELHNKNPEFQKLLIDEVLVNPEFNVTRAFFNSFLQTANSLPTNTFEIYQSQTYLRNSTYHDELIHILAKDGCIEILKLILKCIDFKISRAKELTVPNNEYKNERSNMLDNLQSLVRLGGINIEDKNGNTPLHYAAMENHKDMVKFLVDQGANVNSVNENGYLAIHLAAELGHLDTVKFFWENKININTPNKNNQSVLHLAAKGSRLDIVHFLLRNGIDINIQDSESRTALHFAAERGGLGITKLLVQAGADINARDGEGRTSLHLAADWCQLETVKFLAELGGNINFKDNCSHTPLHLAALRGHLDIVTYLVKLDADIDIKDDIGRTALHLAAEWGASDIVKFLAELGADINTGDNYGRTALHFATRDGDIEIVKVLVKLGVDIDTTDNDGLTALYSAIYHEQMDIADFLIICGGNINIKDNFGRSALHSAILREQTNIIEFFVRHGKSVETLHLAASLGQLNIVKFLIERSVYVHGIDCDGRTALHLAASQGHLDVVKFLAGHGGGANIRDEANQTALHLAVLQGHLDIIEFLVAHGGDIQIKDKAKQTPLHLAAEQGHFHVVKFLVELGLPLGSRNINGFTALHLAASHGHLDVLELLMRRGGNANIKTKSDEIPLHLAAFEGHFKVVKYLVECGLNVDSKNIEGLTAMHLAVLKGHLEIVKFLVGHGADIYIRDKSDKTSLHLAAAQGHFNIVKFLAGLGVPLGGRNIHGFTALHVAAFQGHLDIVQFLLEHGEGIHSKSNCGATALHLAASQGHLDIVRFLIELGAAIDIKHTIGLTAYLGVVLMEYGKDVNIKNNSGQTALHLAALRGNLDIVKFLVTHGGDLSIRDKSGSTALHLAASKGHLSITKFLVELGTPVDSRNIDGLNSLHLAASGNHFDIVKFLVIHEEDANISDKFGSTVLHLAASKGYFNIVKFLVEFGINVNATNIFGLTALHLAALEGYLGIVEILVGYKGNINTRDEFGQTPIHFAASRGHSDVIVFLIIFGGDVNITNSSGQTALHSAASKGYFNVIKALVDLGVSVDSKDNNGLTALHLVAAQGRLDVVKFLVGCGGDIDIKDKSGLTLTDLAVSRGHLDVVKFLTLIEQKF